jgi:hypothetical protein
MYLRLRQLCLVAKALDPVVEALQDVFRLGAGFRDANVGPYGLVNAVLPVGAAFVEVVSPIREGTTAERYLERRRGDGGYMVILDCGDLDERRRHLASLGVRIANAVEHDGYRGLQLHPRDTGGAMLELNRTEGGDALDGPYHPAGPDWRARRRRDGAAGIAAAEIQSADPAALAARWGEILQRPVRRSGSGAPEIALDLGALRFVPAEDGRGDGLAGVDLVVADRARVDVTAARRGIAADGDALLIGGVRWRGVAAG